MLLSPMPCGYLVNLNLKSNKESIRKASLPHLLLLLLNGLQVGFEVKVLLVLGAQQNTKHGLSRDLHSPQGRLLEFTLQLYDLQIHIIDLTKGQNAQVSRYGILICCVP